MPTVVCTVGEMMSLMMWHIALMEVNGKNLTKRGVIEDQASSDGDVTEIPQVCSFLQHCFSLLGTEIYYGSPGSMSASSCSSYVIHVLWYVVLGEQNTSNL